MIRCRHNCTRCNIMSSFIAIRRNERKKPISKSLMIFRVLQFYFPSGNEKYIIEVLSKIK